MFLSNPNLFLFLNLFAGSIGIFLSLVLFFQKIKSNYLNNYLVFILFVFGLRIIVNQFIHPTTSVNNSFSKGPLHLLFLANFNIFYFYMRSLARGYEKLSWSDLYYFIPMFTLIGINYFLLHFYPQYLLEKNAFNVISFFCIHIFFIFKTLKMLKDTIWGKKEISYFANRKLLKKWVVFCVSMFLLLSSKFYTSINFEDFSNNDLRNVNSTLINSLFLLILITIVLSTPKLFYGVERMKTTLIDRSTSNRIINFNKLWLKKSKAIANEQNQLLNDRIGQTITSIKMKISSRDFNQNLFRKPELEIGEFANNLGYPKSHVSLLFKYYSTISFIEFRTIVRIDIAIAEIDKGYLQLNTMESLASSIGFASYNPFFTAFKKYVGLSPKKYQIQQTKMLNASIANSIPEG